jgi:L-threonine kinase
MMTVEARLVPADLVAMPPGQATVAMPGTCGELVQGTLEGVPCLVSCPIDHYSTARVSLTPKAGWLVPPGAPKAEAALRAGLARCKVPGWGAELDLITDLPRGRGYASSTADVGATVYAVGAALGVPVSPEIAARLAVAIEPTDSTLFDGLTLFAHRTAEMHVDLGPAPAWAVLVIDSGGEVDTLAYNGLDHGEALLRLAPSHLEAFALLQAGLQRRDWGAVGAAATLSARLHQALLFNPMLDSALSLARAVRALGVCRAHSGTLLGLLLDPARADLDAELDFVVRRLPPGVQGFLCRLVEGGPRYL